METKTHAERDRGRGRTQTPAEGLGELCCAKHPQLSQVERWTEGQGVARHLSAHCIMVLILLCVSDFHDTKILLENSSASNSYTSNYSQTISLFGAHSGELTGGSTQILVHTCPWQ